MKRGVSAVVALVLTIAALPPLVARAIGGRPPDPGPKLAALAPVAALLAVTAVIVAATSRWWLVLGPEPAVAGRGIPPVMRLDHVLVSQAGATVPEARIIRVPGTDHRGVLAVIELQPAG